MTGDHWHSRYTSAHRLNGPREFQHRWRRQSCFPIIFSAVFICPGMSAWASAHSNKTSHHGIRYHYCSMTQPSVPKKCLFACLWRCLWPPNGAGETKRLQDGRASNSRSVSVLSAIEIAWPKITKTML